MIRLLFAALIVSGVAVRASAAETYVCVGEKSMGFKWNGSAWEGTSFHSDAKFVISEGETQSDYIIKRAGEAVSSPESNFTGLYRYSYVPIFLSHRNQHRIATQM